MPKAKKRAIVAVISAKGGSGKTTIACHLAVKLNADLVDLDEQQGAAYWAESRAEHEHVAQVRVIDQSEIASSQRDIVIDTPPGKSESANFAISVATHIVVPIRPLGLDIRALNATLDMLDEKQKPFFVLNMVPVRGAEVDEARESLSQYGEIAAEVPTRISIARAIFTGLTIDEYTTDPAVSDQIRDLVRIMGIDG